MPDELLTKEGLELKRLAVQIGLLQLEQDLLLAKRERVVADVEYTRELTRILRLENDRTEGQK